MGIFNDGFQQKAAEWALPRVAIDKPSSFTDNVGAAWDAYKFTDAAGAYDAHLTEAYKKRAETIKGLTGEDPGNPYDTPPMEDAFRSGPQAATVNMLAPLLGARTPEEIREDRMQAYEARVAELLDRLPDRERQLVPTPDAIKDEISREAKRLETRQAEAAANGGLGGLAGQLVGGMGAAMTQPEQLATLPLGAPGKMGLVMRILTEAAIGAGTEAVLQVGVQDQRAKMDLESGLGPALENIAMAGAGGAVFAGGIEGARALIRGGNALFQKRFGRPPNQSEAAALDVARQALEVEAATPYVNKDAATVAVFNANQVAATSAAIDGRPVQPGEIQGANMPARAPSPEAGPYQILDEAQLARIGTDADMMQFKAGGDEFGVTERLAGVKQWEPERSGVMLVYEFSDGRQIIADGHQRLGLAKRLSGQGQDVRAAAMVLREQDGITPAMARARAAYKNMAEGSGSATDAAKILRNSGATLADLNLPPKSAMLRDAEGLAAVNDDVFGMVVNEILPDRFAAAIGRMVKETLLQTNIAGLLNRLKPASLFEAEQIIDQARRTTVTGKQATLFGDEDVAESLYLERARVLERAQRVLRQDATTFRTLLERGSDIADEGNVLDQGANAARLETDQKVMQFVRSLANRKGPIADALTAAATDAKSDGNYSRAARRFLETVGGRIDDPEIAGAAGRGDWGGDEFTRPDGPAQSAPDLSPDEATLNLFENPNSPAVAEQVQRLQNEIMQAVSDSDGGFALPEVGAPVTLLRRPAEQVAAIEAEFKARAPERSIEESYVVLPALQAELEAVGKRLARRKGVTFVSPGLKAIDGAREKMGRKMYTSTREMTDLVRGGFEVETPAQANALVATLAKTYRVLDEGWTANGALYFDRKVLVQFADGTIGEVQIWNPAMLKAKNAGGHKLYTKMRKLQAGSPEYLELLQQQRDLYGAAIDGLDQAWLSEVWSSAGANGGKGGALGKIDPKIDAETGVPLSSTSDTSAGSQAALPVGTAKAAESPNTTAGRDSQLKNDGSISDTPHVGNTYISTAQAVAQGLEPPVPAGHVRFYHGGDISNVDTGRWVSPTRQYAADFRNENGDKPLSYVDIPETDPAAIAARGWDDETDAGTNMVGHYINSEIPAEWAARLQPTARTGLAVEPGAEGLPQTLLPGVNPIQMADRLAIDAARALDASRAPDMDYGLFGDSAAQVDLLDMLRNEGPDLRAMEIPLGERLDADGNKVAETQTLGQVLDDIAADDEFLNQLAICDRSAA